MAGVALLLAGPLYAAWVLGYELNPWIDARNGFTSDLAALDQPYHALFSSADVATGALVLIAVAFRLVVPFGPVGRAAAAGWVALAIFGGGTILDALLDLPCASYNEPTCALLERSGHTTLGDQSHAYSSAVGVVGILAAMLFLSIAARRAAGAPSAAPGWRTVAVIGPWLLGLNVAMLIGTLVAMLAGEWTGVVQRIQLGGVSLWLLLLGAVLLGSGRLDQAGVRVADLTPVGGVPVHVVSDGAGDPPVLLVAGVGEAWFDWDPVLPLLVGRHRVVRFDRPGLGASPRAPGLLSLDAEVERIAAVIDRLALPPPVVVAHSVGAMHAEAFARRYPDRLSGMVLVDPSVEPAVRPRGQPTRLAVNSVQYAASMLATLGTLTGLAPAVGHRLRDALYRSMSHRRAGPGTPEQVRAVFGSGHVVAAVLAEYLAYRDMAAALPAERAARPYPTVPTIVLTAMAVPDAERCRRDQAQLADLLGGRQVLLPNSRHMVQSDDPQAVADAVATVVRQCVR